MQSDDALELIASGPGLPMLSFGTVLRPLGSPEAAITRARAFYRGRAERFMLSACGETAAWLEPAARAAQGLGMRRSFMLLAPIPDGHEGPAVPGLAIGSVATAAEFAVYNDTMTAGFGGERWAHLDALDVEALLAVPGSEHFVARLDGRPVGTAMRLSARGVTIVANVSVIPEARRRGIGERLTWRAVQAGRAEGDDAAYLQPSDLGAPMYAHMGFRWVRAWQGWLIAP